MDLSVSDSSLEAQIKDARMKATLFSKSLQEAREQEAQALKILEDERTRWTQSFEEKSLLINQLEQELTSTVDALNQERRVSKEFEKGYFEKKSTDHHEDHYTSHNSRREYEDNVSVSSIGDARDLNRVSSPPRMQRTSTAHSPPKSFVDTSFGSQNHRNPSQQNDYNSHSAKHYDPADRYYHAPPAPLASQIFQPYNKLVTQQPLHTSHSPSPPPFNTVPPPQEYYRQLAELSQEPSPTPQQMSVAQHEDATVRMWRDLVTKFSEQLRDTKDALTSTKAENATLSTKVKELSEEKELRSSALEESRIKLEFRTQQVLDLEHEKLAHETQTASLVSQIDALTAQLAAAHQRVTAKDTECVAAKERIGVLETQLGEAHEQIKRQGSSHFATDWKAASLLRDQNEDEIIHQINVADAQIQQLNVKIESIERHHNMELSEARRVASTLQIQLKDSERRCDEWIRRTALVEDKLSAMENLKLNHPSDLSPVNTSASTVSVNHSRGYDNSVREPHLSGGNSSSHRDTVKDERSLLGHSEWQEVQGSTHHQKSLAGFSEWQEVQPSQHNHITNTHHDTSDHSGAYQSADHRAYHATPRSQISELTHSAPTPRHHAPKNNATPRTQVTPSSELTSSVLPTSRAASNVIGNTVQYRPPEPQQSELLSARPVSQNTEQARSSGAPLLTHQNHQTHPNQVSAQDSSTSPYKGIHVVIQKPDHGSLSGGHGDSSYASPVLTIRRDAVPQQSLSQQQNADNQSVDGSDLPVFYGPQDDWVLQNDHNEHRTIGIADQQHSSYSHDSAAGAILDVTSSFESYMGGAADMEEQEEEDSENEGEQGLQHRVKKHSKSIKSSGSKATNNARNIKISASSASGKKVKATPEAKVNSKSNDSSSKKSTTPQQNNRVKHSTPTSTHSTTKQQQQRSVTTTPTVKSSHTAHKVETYTPVGAEGRLNGGDVDFVNESHFDAEWERAQDLRKYKYDDSNMVTVSSNNNSNTSNSGGGYDFVATPQHSVTQQHSTVALSTAGYSTTTNKDSGISRLESASVHSVTSRQSGYSHEKSEPRRSLTARDTSAHHNHNSNSNSISAKSGSSHKSSPKLTRKAASTPLNVTPRRSSGSNVSSATKSTSKSVGHGSAPSGRSISSSVLKRSEVTHTATSRPSFSLDGAPNRSSGSAMELPRKESLPSMTSAGSKTKKVKKSIKVKLPSPASYENK